MNLPTLSTISPAYRLHRDAFGRLILTDADGTAHEDVTPVRAFPICAPDEVSSYATPSFWQVITDRGETALTLKGEENIRRLPGNALLIADSHGINYLIRDRLALDAQSRKFLDRFL